MLRFKQYLMEIFHKDVIDEYKKRKLISTFHAKERTEEREANNAIVSDIFKKAVDHITDPKKITNNKEKRAYSKGDHFFVTSKKHNRSIAFHYREDSRSGDTRPHFIHVSTMPEGNHRPETRDRHIRVEEIENDIEYIFIDVE